MPLPAGQGLVGEGKDPLSQMMAGKPLTAPKKLQPEPKSIKVVSRPLPSPSNLPSSSMQPKIEDGATMSQSVLANSNGIPDLSEIPAGVSLGQPVSAQWSFSVRSATNFQSPLINSDPIFDYYSNNNNKVSDLSSMTEVLKSDFAKPLSEKIQSNSGDGVIVSTENIPAFDETSGIVQNAPNSKISSGKISPSFGLKFFDSAAIKIQSAANAAAGHIRHFVNHGVTTSPTRSNDSPLNSLWNIIKPSSCSLTSPYPPPEAEWSIRSPLPSFWIQTLKNLPENFSTSSSSAAEEEETTLYDPLNLMPRETARHVCARVQIYTAVDFGEACSSSTGEDLCETSSNCLLGKLIITNYRILFQPYWVDPNDPNHAFLVCSGLCSIPISSIRSFSWAYDPMIGSSSPGCLKDEISIPLIKHPMASGEGLAVQQQNSYVGGVVGICLITHTSIVPTVYLIHNELNGHTVVNTITQLIAPKNVSELFTICADPPSPSYESISSSPFRPELDLKRLQLDDDDDDYFSPAPKSHNVPIACRCQEIPTASGIKLRISHANSAYSLCGSYPPLLVVPQDLDDTELRPLSGCRARGRLPVCVWRHPKIKTASLWRCSQPTTAFKRCREDERLFCFVLTGEDTVKDTKIFSLDSESIVNKINEEEKKVHIFDARPFVNAVASKVVGAGYEDVNETHSACQIEFASIQNIHQVASAHSVVRKSLTGALQSLKNVCPVWDSSSSHLQDDTYSVDLSKSVSFITSSMSVSKLMSAIYGSCWYDYILTLLRASVAIVGLLDKKKTVVVHCSDGWDRTSQLAALSKLLMDPFYRTLNGFCVLIEVEFRYFGHKFHTRNGLPGGHSPVRISDSDSQSVDADREKNFGSIQSDASELSPIFAQFLDCVFQLISLRPHDFEFNESFLLAISYHVHSSFFGTFLLDNQRDREIYRVDDRCPCLWKCITSSSNSQKFKNPNFKPYKSNCTCPLLPPCLDPRSMKIWWRFWLRNHPLYFCESN